MSLLHLPPGAPSWIIALAIIAVVIIAVIGGGCRLAKAIMPQASADRLAWWESHRAYRERARQRRSAQYRPGIEVTVIELGAGPGSSPPDHAAPTRPEAGP